MFFGTLIAGEAPSAANLLLAASVASSDCLAGIRSPDGLVDIRIGGSLSGRILTA